MTIGIITFAAVAIFALLVLVRMSHTSTAQPSSAVATSPIDEAERILASRYASGRITAEEYERMRAILRT